MMENRFKPGDIVQHFKREMLSYKDARTDKYLYEIIGVATHSETGEPMMVYRALYDDGGMYVRPLEMFLSEVDHEKYPDIVQKYRFEKIKTVPIKLIEDAIEMTMDEWNQYLDIEKMEIVSVPDDPYMYYEGREAYEELTELIDTEYRIRFFRLPDQYDIHEHSIMEHFVWELPAGEMRDHLDNAIHRKGAFRRFKDSIYDYGIQQDWYDYLNDAYKQIARDWCKENGIRYSE